MERVNGQIELTPYDVMHMVLLAGIGALMKMKKGEEPMQPELIDFFLEAFTTAGLIVAALPDGWDCPELHERMNQLEIEKAAGLLPRSVVDEFEFLVAHRESNNN